MNKAWQNWLGKRFQFQQQKKLSQKDILIFMYKQGYLYLVLILITFVAGINYANNLILGFCFLISAILCISFYLTFKQLHGLDISLSVDELGQVGQQSQLHLYFKQATTQPRYLYIQIDDELHKIFLTESKQSIAIAFEPEQRGKFDYPSIKIYSIYPFGLVRAWTYLYHQKTAWIAPKAAFYQADNKHQQLLNEQKDFDEFRELRNYQIGDSLHSVSWKQVARGQGLYVKMFEQHQDEQHLEIHYSHMPSTSHEERLSLMMGLVEQCEQLQYPYSLHLPKAELQCGQGIVQLTQAKQLLAQA